MNESDSELELLQHSDLNFDGFEDLQILQFHHPHLGTRIYCIYVWDEKSGHFRYAPELPSINPVPHPESKTITVHQDWQGGIYRDSTFRWAGADLELINESGRVFGSDVKECSFTDYCDKRINGKMLTTLWRPVVCSDNRVDPELICPANATHAAPNAPRQKKIMPVK